MADSVTLKMDDGSERHLRIYHAPCGNGAIELSDGLLVLMRFRPNGCVETVARKDAFRPAWNHDSEGRIIIDGPPAVFPKPKNPTATELLGIPVTAGAPLSDETLREVLSRIPAHIKQGDSQ